MDSRATTQKLGQISLLRRDSQLLASFLVRTNFLAQFCTILKSQLFHRIKGGEIFKTAELLSIINVQNSGLFSLASQMGISHGNILLVNYPILMLFNTVVIFVGSPITNILSNGQMAQFNRNGMAQEMCLVAV
jgi:hypothetical protein